MRHSRPASLRVGAVPPSSARHSGRKNRRFLKIAPRIALGIALLAIALAVTAPNAGAQANVTGTWQTLPTTMPINPVHIALMHTGKILVVSGSGNYPPDTSYMAAVWDPATDTVTTMPVAWDMFCNGMVVMPDGRPFVMGGTLQYDPFYGHQKTSAFNPTTGTFADQQSMADGRWYPTGLVLGDGRVMVFSGLGLTGNTNTTVEFYTMGKGWSQPFNAPWTPPLYPRLHLLPNGNVFYSGSSTNSALFNPSNEAWTQNVASTIYSGTRTYGSSVLMPLTPANGFKPRVMIFGGGSPATTTTEIIDLSVANPKWASGVAMSQARIEMNATLLPSGQFLATGGSVNDEDASTESLNADMYDSVSGERSSAGANAFARLYHSNSILLPDATVLLIGGNPTRGTYESHMEIYTPAYLYNSSGQLATRPTISSVSSSVLGYNAGFTITTPNASSISSVVLMRAGAVTHAFDMDQRLVGLSFTAGSGVLNATTPTNGNLAPPGYYLLFVLDSSGVPSVAQFAQLMTTPGTPPTGTITSPSSDVTIAAGQSVSFAGTGNAPGGSIASYDWVFPGGSPGSSTAASAGNVTYSTPGTYTASFTVTDNSGRTDPNPPTRTITVNQGFSLSASPSSRTVAAGSGTSYTVTVTPSSGFSGTVSFTASGAPSGVTATFNPTTVTTSGSTTMSVTTTSAVAAGTYPLTINGSSSGVAVQTSVNLVVTGGSSGGTITFVQGTSNAPQGNASTVSATYPAIQTNGNLNVVVIAWNDSVTTLSSITDTLGNSYVLAAGPTKVSGTATQSVYYAKGIVSDGHTSNTVKVTFSASAPYPDLRIVEYAGADPTSPLDVATGNSGTSATTTATLTTTNANDLILASNYLQYQTTGPGTGYTSRMITADSDIVEDKFVTAAGSNTATAPMTFSGWWLMSAAAFRALSGPPDTQPPTAPTNLTATVASNTQINLSWTASTDNVGVTGYRVEQCQGSGCSTFAQVGTTTGATTYSATGLTAGTSYSYRVRATDAAGNLSAYSNTASATTTAPDTQPPTAPSNLTATAASTTQINLSWTASTDNVGVTGYKVEQCQGASCSNFAQVGTTTGATTYSATGLTTNTSYSYRVRATDAAGNLSSYSNTASATTLADTQAPTAPTNLTATAFSSVQINLSWTASTDNVGVTGYKVEQCQGASCSNFAQVGTTSGTGTTYSATGLTASTSYSYRVRATDAAGNLSGYSNTASATTSTAPPPTVTFVQIADSAPQGNATSTTATFALAQGGGDLNIVFIGWNDSTTTVKTVADSKGNVYQLAVGPTTISGLATQAIYYAPNIAAAAANANSVTVTFSGSAPYPDLRILEYSGVPASNPIDGVGTATGSSATVSASVTTTNATDVIVASDYVQYKTTGAGSGFTSRVLTPDGGVVEDEKLTTTGTFAATAPQSPGGWWVMQVIAIK